MQKLKLRKNRLFFLLISMLILNGCTPQNMDGKFYKEYLGIDISPNKKIFSYQEESAQNEGFSFDILKYEIKGKLDLKEGYPIKDKYRQNWQVSKWKETPSLENGDFDIIFKYSIDDKNINLKVDKIKDILEKKGNYYCYYYKKSSDYVEAINLYIIDNKSNTLYIFNVET